MQKCQEHLLATDRRISKRTMNMPSLLHQSYSALELQYFRSCLTSWFQPFENTSHGFNQVNVSTSVEADRSAETLLGSVSTDEGLSVSP